ncbi:MAG: peptide deformylase [Candidatus Pacebacteria bacterium]|nr:peptide deformylase [Candidatus Paceibacterota bacterium]
MKEIVQVGVPVLRQVAQAVPLSDIPSLRIQKILRDMEEALMAEPDGAALAAPQIGVSLRIFILSRRVFTEDGTHDTASKDPHFIYINPVIIRRSRRKSNMDEGCLSVRGKYGTIIRSTNVTIEAYDEHGLKFTRGAGGLLAQAFQHETDHLGGTLFIDTAKELWDVDIKRAPRE